MNENPRLYQNYDKGMTARLEERLKDIEIKPDFDDNSISILAKRYFRKDENGMPQEDVGGLFRRVAANIAYPDFHYSRDEKQAYETAKKFYEMTVKREFMPNSPTLMNAGREMQQLSACFVLPIEDHMTSIFGQVYNTAMIHKSGGGTGFSFSRLRRKNDFVSSTYGKASGPISFIIAYDAATHSVNQGGFRRGANMGILRMDHPDILEFVHAKENEKERRFENFNFSVAITDELMELIKNGGYYVLKNPRDGKIYELTAEDLKRDEISVKQGLIGDKERVLVVDENNNVIYQNPIKRNLRGLVLEVEKKKVGKVDGSGRITLDAKIVFDEIAQLAWKNGEPGIAFIDRINEYNPTPSLGEIESTNPCGEQPLLSYEACNLGSINLDLMVEDGKIDYKKLERVIKDSVHFLDNVIDMSNFPLEEIVEMVSGNRKIGLGVMGFADMLFKLKIPYNSDEAIQLAEDIMRFIQIKSVEESEQIASQRGVFPNFCISIYANEKQRRNATTTTIAPTGTISIIAKASSGIEPIFGLFYTHKDADGQIRKFGNKNFVRDLKEAGVDAERVIKDLSDPTNPKSLRELDYVPEKIKSIYVTARDIPVVYHVKMQAAFQKYTDNAVSKTINLPHEATVADVREAFLLAYKTRCKGITLYREGSREEEVLRKDGLEKKIEYITAKKRPKKLYGHTVVKKTGCGNLFVTLNYDEHKKYFFEVFAQMGKGGGCAASQNEAIGRLSSFLLRVGADPKELASQLVGIGCNKPYGIGPDSILSCSDAIGKILAEELGEKVEKVIGDSENFENLLKNGKGTNAQITSSDLSRIGGSCPQCGSSMAPKEGCMGGVCTNLTCGYSECG